jgi:hypothetical protein
MTVTSVVLPVALIVGALMPDLLPETVFLLVLPTSTINCLILQELWGIRERD